MQSLYLSYDGMTDQLGQSQVIPYLQKLSAAGYRITLISFEKKDAFQKQGAYIESVLKEFGIEWVPFNYHKSPPILSTFYDFVKMKRAAKKICSSQQIKIVHCRSYISALVGHSLKNKFGIKFIFDMRGFWADERVEGKIWNIKNPVYLFLYNYFKKEEKKLLSGADHIVTLTEKARDIIKTWQLKQLPEITVIPCCADMNHFDPSKLNHAQLVETRLKLNIGDSELVLGYLGAIGTWYMLNEMLDFYKHLLITYPSAKFLFITKELASTIINAASKKNIPSDSLIICAASRNEVPLYISLMDISIFFIRPTFSKKASSPTKMAELLSMGVPVICNAGVGDDDVIMESTGAGLVCYELNTEGYKKVVNNLKTILDKKPDELRQVANSYFSLEMGSSRYRMIYERL